MSTEHLAPSQGAVLLDGEQANPLLRQAETLLIPDRRLVVPIESIIDLDKSDPLEDATKKLLKDPRVGRRLVAPGAKCNWRVPHMVLTADMVAKAAREKELEMAGFSFTEQELEDMMLALLLHDVGFAYTGLPSDVLNPLEEGNLRESPVLWGEAMTHPDRTASVLQEDEFSPYTIWIAGNHHNFGGRKDGYGGKMLDYDRNEVHLPSEREQLIAPWVDVPHAAGDERRLYKPASGLSEIEAIMRKLFIGEPGEIPEEQQIPERLLKFFAKAAHERGNFYMPATDEMDAFVAKVIGTQELWENPGGLTVEFAKFARIA
jgi:hypothetical protein